MLKIYNEMRQLNRMKKWLIFFERNGKVVNESDIIFVCYTFLTMIQFSLN